MEEQKAKRCYYEIMEIDKKADQDTIRKKFKRLTIKLHPDKNSEDPLAKEKFQELNEAYQVLSDPNERAWYDSHRNEILNGGNGNDSELEQNKGFEFNIWKYFSQSCYQSTSEDNISNFYKVYRELFQKIIIEEENARQYDDEKEDNFESFLKAPGFGDESTHIDDVIKFYRYWENFVSCKSFAWADQYKAERSDDRYIKRHIKKDSRKRRVKAKKAYNETLKSLVDFIKKRDRRWDQVVEMNKEKEKQKEIEEAEKAKEKEIQKQEQKERARIAEIERMEELEKYRESNTVMADKHADLEDEDAMEEFYCQICKKTFKSEGQMRNHEKSKAHLKKVKKILEEVALDDEMGMIDDIDEQLEEKKPAEPIRGGLGKKKKKKKKKNMAGIYDNPLQELEKIEQNEFEEEKKQREEEELKKQAELEEKLLKEEEEEKRKAEEEEERKKLELEKKIENGEEIEEKEEEPIKMSKKEKRKAKKKKKEQEKKVNFIKDLKEEFADTFGKPSRKKKGKGKKNKD